MTPRLSDELVRRLHEVARGDRGSNRAILPAALPSVVNRVAVVEEAVAAMNLAKAALAGKKLAVARAHEETALVGAGQCAAKHPQAARPEQLDSRPAPAAPSTASSSRNSADHPRTRRSDNWRVWKRTCVRWRKKSVNSPRRSSPARDRGSQTDRASAPTSGDPAARQQQAAKEAERLRDLARQDRESHRSHPPRLGHATETIRKSAEQIQGRHPEEAAEGARAAAEQLERLARQVGALKASELADQMARTRDLTRELAAEERALAQTLPTGRTDGNDKTDGRWAKRERDLAEEASSLGDLMDRLRDEASAVDMQLARTLGEAARSNPTREIAKVMEQSALETEAGRRSAAKTQAENASDKLDEMARDLESARRGLVQPQLDRFLAAEKQAARVQDQMSSVKSGAQQAEVERGLSDLARSLESIASAEGSCARLPMQLNRAIGPGASREWRRVEDKAPSNSGLFIPPTNYTKSVRGVVLGLQARIQQLVLDRALMERDQAVPPRYKTLVEDYYRVLSQDLR